MFRVDVEVSPEVLYFPPPLSRAVRNVVVIRNKSLDTLEYKVKTATPQNYSIRPREGTITMGRTIHVHVTRIAKDQAPKESVKKDNSIAEPIKKDKFLFVFRRKYEKDGMPVKIRAEMCEPPEGLFDKNLESGTSSSVLVLSPCSVSGKERVEEKEKRTFVEEVDEKDSELAKWKKKAMDSEEKVKEVVEKLKKTEEELNEWKKKVEFLEEWKEKAEEKIKELEETQGSE